MLPIVSNLTPSIHDYSCYLLQRPQWCNMDDTYDSNASHIECVARGGGGVKKIGSA